MSISFGNKNVKEMYFGNKKVAKVYFGNKLVWPSGSTEILLFDEGNTIVAYEYVPETDCIASSITYHTADTSLNKGSLFTQVYDEYGFCVFSSWDSEANNYSLSLVTLDGVSCEKVVYTFTNELKLYEGKKYYFISVVNRWDNSNKSKQYGYVETLPHSKYKLLSANHIIENPTTGALPEDATVLTAHTKADYVALFTEDNWDNYVIYDGPKFSFGSPDATDAVGATIIKSGVYKGSFTNENDAKAATEIGDIVYGNWGAWWGQAYCIKASANEWCVDGQWTSRPGNMPFEPVKGCYSQISSLPIQNDRNYKIEIKVQQV